jgi:murein DD-endopeptidase MepM/ murein hydrolase activator NlpD
LSFRQQAHRRAVRRVSAVVLPRVLVVALVLGSVSLDLVVGAATGGAGATHVGPETPPAMIKYRSGSTSPSGSGSPVGVPVGGAVAALASVSRSHARPSLAEMEVSLAAALPVVPEIVRFRPREGWRDVSRSADVSVRFTRPMDHGSTEAVFTTTIDGKALTGAFRWAEGDTVLVLRPARPFPYGATVELAVEHGARAIDGAILQAGARIRFPVEARPLPAPTSRATGAQTTAWRWPLIGPITQRFGESLTKYGFHYGIDIDGSTGDPVRAARSGIVTTAGHHDECGGLQVHVDHGDGFVSWYRHLSRVDVAKGTRVAAGDRIGAVGNTGCSLGSHLHFGIRKGKTFVDPLRYLPPR